MRFFLCSLVIVAAAAEADEPNSRSATQPHASLLPKFDHSTAYLGTGEDSLCAIITASGIQLPPGCTCVPASLGGTIDCGWDIAGVFDIGADFKFLPCDPAGATMGRVSNFHTSRM
jgi:hypothetical protein